MKSLKSLSWILFFLVFNGCSKNEMRSGGNRAPVADAGENVTLILPQSSTTLDGRASSDSDGTIVGYQWKQISGPLSCIIEQPQKSVTAARNFRAGTYEFELTVTDNNGLSSKDIKIVEVISPTAGTKPPIANAGEDDTLLLSEAYTYLNGGASKDSDGMIVSYEWRQISGPFCIIEEPRKWQTKIKNFSIGTYEFELTVTDNDGLSSKDVKQVEVIDPAQQTKEIVNSNLLWQYLPLKGLVSARLTDLRDPPDPNSADSIDAVYKFSNSIYTEVSKGNPGNSNNIYYEIETKSLLLRKKYSIPNLDTTSPNWQFGAAIGFAIAMPSLNLPKKAKVVFR